MPWWVIKCVEIVCSALTEVVQHRSRCLAHDVIVVQGLEIRLRQFRVLIVRKLRVGFG